MRDDWVGRPQLLLESDFELHHGDRSVDVTGWETEDLTFWSRAIRSKGLRFLIVDRKTLHRLRRAFTFPMWKIAKSGPVRHPAERTLAMFLRAVGGVNDRWRERARRAASKSFIVELLKDDRITANRLGFTFDLNLSDNLQRTLFLCGTYESEFLGFLEAEIVPGDVYIDIGGHIGLDAFVVARKLSGRGHVVCFEPSQDSADAIRTGSLRNGLNELITVVQCGLANENGSLVLRTDLRYLPNDQATRSRYNDGEVVVEAPLRRFDDWASEVKLQRMDVVKLDIEGCEFDALAGMTASVKELAPRAIVVEVGDRRLRQAGTSAKALDELLDDLRYERTGQVFMENVVYRPK
jgi:FkbM family methyltransferase